MNELQKPIVDYTLGQHFVSKTNLKGSIRKAILQFMETETLATWLENDTKAIEYKLQVMPNELAIIWTTYNYEVAGGLADRLPRGYFES